MKIKFKPFDEETQTEIIRLHTLGYGSSSITVKMRDWKHGAPSGSRVYFFLKSMNLTRDQKTARAMGCTLRNREPKARRGE